MFLETQGHAKLVFVFIDVFF